MNKFSKPIYSALWIASSAALVAAGIGCFVYNSSLMEGRGSWVSILIIFSGLLQVVRNWIQRLHGFERQGMTQRASLTLIAGISLICRTFIAAEALRVMFGMVALSSGIGLLNTGWEARKSCRHANMLMIAGLIEAVFGFASFLKFVMHGFTVGVAIGLIMFVQAAVLVVMWLVMMGVINDNAARTTGPVPSSPSAGAGMAEPKPAPAESDLSGKTAE